MTTRRPKQISEPVLPEHQLIRDSAPLPELSAGFKSRVMAECSVSVASAAKVWRWKVGSATAAVCALGLLICVIWPNTDDASQTVIRQVDRAANPAPQFQLPDSVSGTLSADMPKPPATKKKSSAGGNELIEGLNQRQQLFDANMVPHF